MWIWHTVSKVSCIVFYQKVLRRNLKRRKQSSCVCGSENNGIYRSIFSSWLKQLTLVRLSQQAEIRNAKLCKMQNIYSCVIISEVDQLTWVQLIYLWRALIALPSLYGSFISFHFGDHYIRWRVLFFWEVSVWILPFLSVHDASAQNIIQVACVWAALAEQRKTCFKFAQSSVVMHYVTTFCRWKWRISRSQLTSLSPRGEKKHEVGCIRSGSACLCWGVSVLNEDRTPCFH